MTLPWTDLDGQAGLGAGEGGPRGRGAVRCSSAWGAHGYSAEAMTAAEASGEQQVAEVSVAEDGPAV